jgi:hypothetical protein
MEISMENITPVARSDVAPRLLQWSPILIGAFAATALSSVLLTFAVTIGLGVTSTAPTWRDASAALAILSGLYLIIQAVLSFGLGGYIAGHSRLPAGAAADDIEHIDGAHGLGAWAVAVVMGTLLAALIGAATISRTPSMRGPAQASTAEPLLSLLTTSSYSGVSVDDRTYLIQQVGALTGLSAADAERRVDSVLGSARTAIQRSRRSSIILAFSVATAILLGAVAAWAAACAGGRHRDGATLPEWMVRSNAIGRRHEAVLP